MQMIDLMKRLAELDAQNPNVVQETNFERPETRAWKSRERNAGLEHETNNVAIEINGKVWKVIPGESADPVRALNRARAMADTIKRNAEAKGRSVKVDVYVTGASPTSNEGYKNQDMEEGTDGTFNGHQIIANRKTPKGSFLILKNKNDGQYEIHRQSPGAAGGLEFVSVHKTPEEMQAAFKNLTGVDENNNQQDVAEELEQNLEECGMMDSMGSMSQPHTPASINMTAASGEELSGMLKDIMSLAGLNNDSEMPMSTEPAAQTLEPAGPEMDATTSMRSVIDKMNPADDEEKTDEEWDNEPNPETSGYDSMTPAGDDLHKQKTQYPAAQPGDNAMAMEQQLMAEYKKFISEEQGMEEGMPSSVAKHKQQLADMSDTEFAEKYGSKSDEELMAMAWRNGYGKGSKFYVNKKNKGKAGGSEE